MSKSIDKRVTVDELPLCMVMEHGGRVTHQMYIEFEYKGEEYCWVAYFNNRTVPVSEIEVLADNAIERTIKRVA